jgi:phytanoyl-CoA hydroxylase
LLQHQSTIKPLQLKRINGMNVNHPKDLSYFSNRTILAIETTFPKSFQLAKRLVTKAATSLSLG